MTDTIGERSRTGDGFAMNTRLRAGYLRRVAVNG